jgi:hypothetical protein
MTAMDLQASLADSSLSSYDKAVLILWNESQAGTKGLTAYGISKKMTEMRVGNPNRAQLEKDLNRSSDVIKVGGCYQLKAGRADRIRKVLRDAGDHPVVDLSNAYIPEEIWRGTRNYIEKVATQVCGCWDQKFYDAAAVMLRRLSETLIIEAYERLGRQREIQDSDGNYWVLGALVDQACGQSGLNLGREAKGALKAMKEHGDRSAHNRRTNAVRPELERMRAGARTAVEELINVARLKG